MNKLTHTTTHNTRHTDRVTYRDASHLKTAFTDFAPGNKGRKHATEYKV